jgi:glycosyltransferase involved in cell wall biosynthesis
MKITFVLPRVCSSIPTGGYRIVYEYANRLSSLGHNITVVHCGWSLLPEDITNHNGIKERVKNYLRPLKYRYFPKRVETNWFKISRKVKSIMVPYLLEKYLPESDVIVATAWQTAEWVNMYGDKVGGKFYLIQSYETWAGFEDRVNATWKMGLKKIVIAKWLQDLAIKFGDMDSEYIPNAFDFDIYKIITRIEERHPYRVCMVYSDSKWKGSSDGFKALEIVKKKLTELKAILFGVKKPSREFPDWVEFYCNASQEKIVELYNSCAIFVGPSLIEGWGLPPCEAMSCGCAVAVTEIGGHNEFAIHEKTALLSPPKNPEALAENILKLCSDFELSYKIAAQGYEYVHQFTWDKSVKRFNEILKNAVREEEIQ